MSTSPLSRAGLSADDEPGAAARSNRKAVLGVAGLGVVGLALATRVLLGGGDELDDLGTSPAAAAQPTVSASATPSPTPSLRFPDAQQVRQGRDPFAPLHVERPATDGAAPDAPPGVLPDPAAPVVRDPAVPAPTAPAPASSTQPAVPRPAVTPAAPGSSPGGRLAVTPPPPAHAARTLALLRVSGTGTSQSAVFTVDGSEHSAAVGESFGAAEGLLLLSLQPGAGASQWTAVVQQGQGEPFDVPMGVAVTLS